MIDLDSALHANRTIVPMIYEVAAGSRPWDDVVTELVEFLDSHACVLAISYFASGHGEVIASHGYPRELLSVWEREHAMNDWIRATAALPAGQILHAARDLPIDLDAELPMVQDVLRPARFKDAMALKLVDSPLFFSGIGTFSRDESLPDHAIDRLEYLRPHLAQGFTLYQRFSALMAQSEAFTRSIDDFPSGLLFFDPDGALLHSNVMARRIAEEQDGFEIRDGKLTFSDPAARAGLEAAITQAREPQPAEVARSFFRVERPSGRRSYHAIVTRAADATGTLAPGIDGVLALWLSDPDQLFVPGEEAISTLLGLTPAESRIAAGLAKGQSVIEYAATAGITENTARSTLKHVFAKTGTRSQADLVRLITQSIPSTPY